MIKNYLLIALRNIFRQKGYSVINILGLSIGLMACLFIVLFIIDEFSYDRHNENGDKIYRFLVEYKNPDGMGMKIPIQAYRLKDAVQTEFPQIEKITRISPPANLIAKFDDIEHSLDISVVDQDFFDIFTIEMLEGDKNTAIDGPGKIIISESSAKKLFGDGPAAGKTIEILSPFGKLNAYISGVFKDIPRTSHFHVDALMNTLITDMMYNERQLYNWGEAVCYVYTLIDNKDEVQRISSGFPEFVKKARGENSSERVIYSLQPLYDIHLKSNLRFEFEPNSDIRYIYIFSLVAFFILLIAAFNYMNLATARSIRRSREVGIRKVTGATRSQLIIQFSGEAVLFTFISLWIAIILTELFLPTFNQISGKSLDISIFSHPGLLLLLFLIAIIIGLLSGLYPAFFLSRFLPVKALYGKVSKTSASVLLRKILVVMQFSISIFLIISTIAIYSQWYMLRNARLGINPENIIITNTPGPNYRTMKEALLKEPGIVSVSALNKKPTAKLSSNLDYTAEDLEEGEGKTIKVVTVDWDFFETIGNNIISGRSFDKNNQSDEKDGFILNKAAVDIIGWQPEDAPGKWFETYTLDSAGVNFVKRKGRVLGVAENFYFESLHNEIKPVVYFIQENWLNWMIIKVSGEDLQKSVNTIHKIWNKFSNEDNFKYSFYDENIEKLYQAERRFFRIFISFAILAIFIASLGILGLISFTAEQRTKEVGIRKTMGASTSLIIRLLASDFLKLVLLANLIAWPVAYFFVKNWLLNFPVKIELGLWIFLSAALLTTIIALFTIMVQAYRAASANPVKALKYE